MNHQQNRKTPDNRAGCSLAVLCAIFLLSTGLVGSAGAAGQPPAKTGPGAPTFTQGDPAYKGLSNAQTHVSANAPAGAAANLTGMVNQPPIISWSTQSNTVVSAPASFALSVNASDPDGSVSKVDYYNGTTLIGSSTSAPFSFSWSNVAAGHYTLTAIATDNLGMSTTAAAITVIANAPPSVSLNAPANNTVQTAPATFALSASASDSDGRVSRVDYYANGSLAGSASSAPYNTLWSNVPAGSYTITAIATDNLGAQTTSTPASISVIAPPLVNLTAPANNTVSVAPASFTFTANASSAGSIAKVEFYQNATLLGAATTATGGTYALTWNDIPAGSYNITAVATDGNGASTTSAPVTVIADALPTVSLTSPSNNATATAPASFTLSADAASSTSSIARVDFYQGGTLLGTATAAPYSYLWNNIPAGNYSLTAVATDSYGIAATSGAMTVTVNTGVAQVYYIHTDQLDTPRVITDTGGNAIWQWDNNDPFGNNMANENPNGAGVFGFNLRFPGQYFDRETSTYYNVMRDYNPAIGRYIESDPIGLVGGINTYTYVGGNPLRYTDQRGLDAVLPGPIPIPLPLPAIPIHSGNKDDGSHGGLFPPGTMSSSSSSSSSTSSSSSSSASSCPTDKDEKEEDCHKQYEADSDHCDAFYKILGFKWWDQCKKEAFGNYQRCRGYGSPD